MTHYRDTVKKEARRKRWRDTYCTPIGSVNGLGKAALRCVGPLIKVWGAIGVGVCVWLALDYLRVIAANS